MSKRSKGFDNDVKPSGQGYLDMMWQTTSVDLGSQEYGRGSTKRGETLKLRRLGLKTLEQVRDRAEPGKSTLVLKTSHRAAPLFRPVNRIASAQHYQYYCYCIPGYYSTQHSTTLRLTTGTVQQYQGICGRAFRDE